MTEFASAAQSAVAAATIPAHDDGFVVVAVAVAVVAAAAAPVLLTQKLRLYVYRVGGMWRSYVCFFRHSLFIIYHV